MRCSDIGAVAVRSQLGMSFKNNFRVANEGPVVGSSRSVSDRVLCCVPFCRNAVNLFFIDLVRDFFGDLCARWEQVRLVSHMVAPVDPCRHFLFRCLQVPIENCTLRIPWKCPAAEFEQQRDVLASAITVDDKLLLLLCLLCLLLLLLVPPRQESRPRACTILNKLLLLRLLRRRLLLLSLLLLLLRNRASRVYDSE